MRLIKVAYNDDDDEPLGYIINDFIEYNNIIPKGYIEYVPHKIFDRRKYTDFYKTFFSDRLPSELEVKLYVNKMKEEKKLEEKLKEKFELDWKIILTFMICVILLIMYSVILVFWRM